MKRLVCLVSFFSIILLLLLGCGGGFAPNNFGTGGGGSTINSQTWNFTSSSNYTFNNALVDVSGGAASIKLADYTVETPADFASGTNAGTTYVGGALSLDPTIAVQSLNATTTPKFADLVGYWTFEGDFTDSSVSGNDGTVVGTSTIDINEFKVGAASLRNNGNGNFVSVADNDSLDADLSAGMTISAWVNLDLITATDRLVAKECSDGGITESSYYLTALNTGVFRFLTSTNGANFVGIDTTSPNVAGVWTHILATYDGAEMKIYKDGVLEGTVARTGIIYNGTTNLTFGARSSGAGCAANDVFYNGNLDDVAIWKVGLSESEALMVYNQQKQKYFGFYDSPVFNAGSATTPWPSLKWVADLPYLKELTGDVNNDGTPNSESSVNYVNLVGSSGSNSDNNLMSSLVALYRFNGAADYTGAVDELKDYARGLPAVNNSGTAVGGNVSAAPGRFYEGRLFNGSGTSITVSPFVSYPEFTEEKSLSFWLKINPTQDDVTGTTNTIILDGDGTRSLTVGIHNQTAAAADIGKLYIEATDGVTTATTLSNTLINDGQFHHIVVMTGGNLRLFMNGEFESEVTNTTAGNYAGTYSFNISSATSGFSGVIDELAYWARPLQFNVGTSISFEAKQLYLRGAARVKKQVRTCIDVACNCSSFNAGGSSADCDGDTILNAVDSDDSFASTWLGPDNTANTFFTELQNNTSISALGEGEANVKRESPLLLYSDFAASGLVVADNQYAQVRTIMESEDESNFCAAGPCLPNLGLVTLGSTNLFGGTVEVSNSIGFPFAKQIISVEVEEVGGANCSFNYQVSNNNGITWYYYNAGTWAAATLATHVTNAVNLNDGIPSFHTQIGTGLFKFRLLMRSLDFTTNCSLNSFKINL